IGRLQPDRGKVLIADHETNNAPLTNLASLDDITMDRLRRHWAVVFQKNALFTGNVVDNIALALVAVKGMSDEQVRHRASEVLSAVGLDPHQVMRTQRDDLSGGMAKRVAIARALALDPVLIFYDEPTSGLDPQHGEQIRDLIRDVHNRMPSPGVKRTSVI